MPQSSYQLNSTNGEAAPSAKTAATYGGTQEPITSPTSASTAVVRRSIGGKKTSTMNGHTAARGSGGGSDGSSPAVRESYAAALWNPMKEADKAAFNRRRLLQLFAGILIATCGGSAFAFGIFSNKIKESAGLSQSDITTIATAGYIFGSFTFPAGMLFDYAGPQYVLMCSTVLCCTGFGLLAMIFQGVVEPSVYSVSAANALTNMGVGFTDSGSLMTNLFSFPVNRGEVLIIQKTFFGLGSTFLSLAFDGFFGQSQNYIGYAVFVTILMFIAGALATVVTRLPPYKRTTRDLNRIAKLDVIEQERERLVEERSFEMFHNPRLSDRRRLNAGVTCLFATLIFFSSFSIIKTYVHIPTDVVTGLTVLAVLCLLSFLIMLVPFQLPRFFDYEFLPDLHPPEALVDTPEDDDDGNNDGEDKQKADGEESVASVSKVREYTIGSNNNDNEEDDEANGAGGEEGRASAFLPTRASVAGNSAPIAVPQGIDPSVVPSVLEGFTTNLLRPLLWCFFITAFALTGASSVLNSNIAQIVTSANGGVFDQKVNSLAVALQGIGSACGRIFIGFAQTYFQRRNALAREAQLAWEAQNGKDDNSLEGGGAAAASDSDKTALMNKTKPDMSPVYHRLTSSVVCALPFSSIIVGSCCIIIAFLPVSAIPVFVCVFGFGYGGYLALVALAVREMFSVDVAKHYNFITAAGILSAILLNRVMFGTWFDQEADKHPGVEKGSCEGHTCFSYSMYVVGSVCFVSVLSSCFIVWKWWQVRRTF